MKIFGRHQIVYQAQAISLESGEAFRKNQISTLGEVRRSNQLTIRVAWTSVTLMGCWSAAMFAGMAYLAPMLQKRIEMHWLVIDRTAPFIQEIPGVEATSKLLSGADALNEKMIREYVEYYYEYSWESNRKHEDDIRMMSSSDQLSRYKKWADEEPNSPKQKLAHHGSSSTDQYHFYKRQSGDANTQEYVVTFTYQETSNGRTDPEWHHYTGHIQFQWHPELVKDKDWVSINPGGFYVTYFKADEDPK